MSIFDSINICDPKPKVISLQEESPEIHSDSKTKHSLPKKSRKNRKFSISKKQNLPKEEEKLDLKLSYELDTVPNASEFPTDMAGMPNAEGGQNFKKFIIETFKNEGELTLREKLAFSLFLVMNRNNFDDELIKEFNEEECHLSLMNWIWRYNKKIKKFQLMHQLKINFLEDFETFLPQYNKLLIEINFIMELLINILNLFVFLPINSSDILHLKLYEKLFNIKGNIKSYANDYLLNLINFVLNKWKTEVDTENETKIITRYKLSKLGIKTSRPEDDKEDKEDTEADSVDGSETNNIKINNNPNIFSNLNKKTKNKNIKVSFDLQQNSVIYFKKDDIPLQISLDKKIQEASNLP
jgi:hypothetical protein